MARAAVLLALALLLGQACALPCRAPGASPPRCGAGVSAEVVGSGLEVPWAIDVAPDGRLFVTERPGRIRVIRDGALQPRPWLELPAESRRGLEMGLLGLAVDPAFASNRYVYVYYTERTGDGRLRNRLLRLRDEGEHGIVDRVLLDDIPGGVLHDGGRLKVGPDGRLYVTTGETEAPQLSQDVRSLAGKILRLERDGSVPPDNPFPGSAVYAFGLRNPQGLAFHPDGGLYATEHGPGGPAPQACCHDEVNRIEPGANYGWPAVIGVARDPRFRDPVHESGDDTWAPSGATFVTRGPFRGSLLIATLRGRHLRRLVFDAEGSLAFEEKLLEGAFGRLRDVVEAPDGSLYVLTSNRDGRGQPGPDDDRVLRVLLR